jgi:hypothetical protein
MRLTFVLAVVLLAAAVTASTALAHPTQIERHYGKAYANEHWHVSVCDLKSDGYQVKIQVMDNGNLYEKVDPDGAGGYCNHHDGYYPNGASSYRLCKVTVDCSEWRQT